MWTTEWKNCLHIQWAPEGLVTRLTPAHGFIPRMVIWFLECCLHPLLHVSLTRHLSEWKDWPIQKFSAQSKGFFLHWQKNQGPKYLQDQFTPPSWRCLHFIGCPARFQLSPLTTQALHQSPTLISPFYVHLNSQPSSFNHSFLSKYKPKEEGNLQSAGYEWTLCSTRHIQTCTEQEKQRAKVFSHQEVGYDFHVKIINHRQGHRKV